MMMNFLINVLISIDTGKQSCERLRFSVMVPREFYDRIGGLCKSSALCYCERIGAFTRAHSTRKIEIKIMSSIEPSEGSWSNDRRCNRIVSNTARTAQFILSGQSCSSAGPSGVRRGRSDKNRRGAFAIDGVMIRKTIFYVVGIEKKKIKWSVPESREGPDHPSFDGFGSKYSTVRYNSCS